MKRILLACCLVIASCTAALAQSGPTSAPTQLDPKLLFSSSTSKFSAGVSRNNSTLAQMGFSESMTVISDCITQLNVQLKTATPVNKNVITAKLQQEQQIYSALQALQSSIMSNAAQIETKFASFKTVM
jgi:phosphotransferase system IIB component